LSIYAKALKRSVIQSKYKIRKLQQHDVPQLMKLTKTVWAEFGFDQNHPDAQHYDEELSKTYETYSAKNSDYFVIVQGRKILGGAGFGPLAGESEDICELKGMYLSNQIRGQGMGALLLQHVLHEAKKSRFKKCYLETMDFMHGANQLYKKMGFIRLNQPKGKTGHHWTNCWYIKDINEGKK
jgi:putative acetyltransferase